MTYLSSADAKATAAAAAEAGGQVLLEPMAVMDLGAMAVLADSTGGAGGRLAAGPAPRASRCTARPARRCWHELHTRDHAGAVAFYQRVFGWHTSVVSDTDEFRYTTMTEGEEQYAGIMDASAYLPEGTPSFWEVYFGVADTDAVAGGRRAARRHGAGAGGGHPVRPDGQGGRPDRRDFKLSPSRPDRALSAAGSCRAWTARGATGSGQRRGRAG